MSTIYYSGSAGDYTVSNGQVVYASSDAARAAAEAQIKSNAAVSTVPQTSSTTQNITSTTQSAPSTAQAAPVVVKTEGGAYVQGLENLPKGTAVSYDTATGAIVANQQATGQVSIYQGGQAVYQGRADISNIDYNKDTKQSTITFKDNTQQQVYGDQRGTYGSTSFQNAQYAEVGGIPLGGVVRASAPRVPISERGQEYYRYEINPLSGSAASGNIQPTTAPLPISNEWQVSSFFDVLQATKESKAVGPNQPPEWQVSSFFDVLQATKESKAVGPNQPPFTPAEAPYAQTKYPQAGQIYSAVRSQNPNASFTISTPSYTSPDYLRNTYDIPNRSEAYATPEQAVKAGTQAAKTAKVSYDLYASERLGSMENKAREKLGDSSYAAIINQQAGNNVVNPSVLYQEGTDKYYLTGDIRVKESNISKTIPIVNIEYSNDKVQAINTAVPFLSAPFDVVTEQKQTISQEKIAGGYQTIITTETSKGFKFDDTKDTTFFPAYRENFGESIKTKDLPPQGIIVGGQYLTQYEGYKASYNPATGKTFGDTSTAATEGFNAIPIFGEGLTAYSKDVGSTIAYGVIKAEVGFGGKTDPMGYVDVGLAVGDVVLTVFTVAAIGGVGIQAAKTVGSGAVAVGKEAVGVAKAFPAKGLGAQVTAGTYEGFSEFGVKAATGASNIKNIALSTYGELAPAIELPIASRVTGAAGNIVGIGKNEQFLGFVEKAAGAETFVNKVTAVPTLYYLALGKKDTSNPISAYASGRAEYFGQVGRTLTFTATPEERGSVVAGFTLANMPYYGMKTISPNLASGSTSSKVLENTYKGMNVLAYGTYTGAEVISEYKKTKDLGAAIPFALGKSHANFATFDYYIESQTIDKAFEGSSFYKSAQTTASKNIASGKLNPVEYASRWSSVGIGTPKIDIKPDISTKVDMRQDFRPDIRSDLRIGTTTDIMQDLRSDIKQDYKQDIKQDLRIDLRSDFKQDIKEDLKPDDRQDYKPDTKDDIKQDLRSDLKQDMKIDLKFPSVPFVFPMGLGGGGGSGGSGVLGGKKISGQLRDLLKIERGSSKKTDIIDFSAPSSMATNIFGIGKKKKR